MTEIPEHLLKRSRERRQALGLGGDDAGSAGTADSKPATAAPAAAAPAAPAGPVERAVAAAPAQPEPPKPDSPVVAAFKARARIPFWAMVALSILPLWAFMYARAVTQAAEEASGPLAIGEDEYGGCATCHGGDGGGVAGLGYQFTDGEVLLTFPNIEDQLRYVYYGTGEYNLAGVQSYGDPDRPGGARITGERGVMPQQGASVGGSLTDYEILGVVCHERYTLGGADPEGDDWSHEYETWCSDESEIFHDLEAGGHLSDLHTRFDDVLPIGDAPAAGAPASG